jgi:hypothetical protein
MPNLLTLAGGVGLVAATAALWVQGRRQGSEHAGRVTCACWGRPLSKPGAPPLSAIY